MFDGNSRDDYFGSSVAVGDLDLDGNADLLVGARQDEASTEGAISNTGTLYGYVSIGENWFDAETPRVTRWGRKWGSVWDHGERI